MSNLGVGLDIGTMNIVAARQMDTSVQTQRIRDAFLDLPLDAKKMLKLSGANYVERADDLLILGDAAMDIANVFGRDARRPMADGLISSSELNSLEVMGMLIRSVLGVPAVENEVCYFSVPASPIDRPEKDIIYHRGVLNKIVNECGFRGIASNEAMAIIYSETALDGFSGISLSFGSGMTNVALAVNTIEGLSFSVARSGDWIDSCTASSVGSTKARICTLKEKGIDLIKPADLTQEAISFYYKALIEYTLDNIVNKFKTIQNRFALPRPIPMIVSGGTSLAGGFVEFFTSVFESKRKNFPIEISEIRHASNPLNAVANGLLVQAMQEYN